MLGIGLASLFSDLSHETASALLPAWLATLGVEAAWLGIIEGVSDGLASFAKLASGHLTDRLARRKKIAVFGYLVTALGTASFGFARTAWHVLAARSFAWLGRGVRTPIRKALLAGSVTRETYGRAFGFERMMDTLGAIAGPAAAFFLLRLLHGDYPRLFALTAIPGLLAVLSITFLVQEKARARVAAIAFGESLRQMPRAYRRFLVSVFAFGLGDFAHTLLILLAVQKLTPALGAVRAAAASMGLYILHNTIDAAGAITTGWLADRWNKRRLLQCGYLLAASMALAIVFLPPSLSSFAVIFALAGAAKAVVETAEDSLCAELVEASHHGMAFGVLATANGVGDFVSSILVGALWSAVGTMVAFGTSAAFFLCGAAFLVRMKDPPAATSVAD